MRADEPTSQEPTVVADGLLLGESPRWHEGRWWCSDWGALEVLAIEPGSGRREVVLTMGSLPFSIDHAPDGDLLVVGDARLERIGRDGERRTVVDLSTISPFPWNEIVVDGRGNTYLNHIGFDMMAGEEPGPGVVALVGPDGATRVVAEGLEFPNGMAVTPDNSTLLVAESYGNRLTAFDIDPDGVLSGRRVWADLGDGCPDGICIDAEGAVWYADVPNRRCVRVCEGGEVRQTVDVDRGCFACMLGGASGRTLGILAADWGGPSAIGQDARSGLLLAVEVSVPGAGWPAR